jgi:hypothetical protein
VIHTGRWLFAGILVLHCRVDHAEFERLYAAYRPEPITAGGRASNRKVT